MTSKDNEATLDGGIGKFVQLTGNESDEEIEQIVDEMSVTLGFGSHVNAESAGSHTGSASQSSSAEAEVGLMELAKAHVVEPSLFVALAGPNPKLGVPIQASADQEWKRLTHDLATCLANLVEDEYLVISFKRGCYYIQFAAQGQFGMRAEAASNAYIEYSKARLSAEGYVAMAQLGWRIPTVLPGWPRNPDSSPNFYLDLAHPVDFKSLSELAARTFRQVYRISHPGQLEYTAFARTGTKICFPTLRLKCAE